MSEHCGKKIRCDRCGEEIFLKYTGEKEFDGGWTKVQYFESLPNNWRYIPVAKSNGKTVNVHLCPECVALYNSLFSNFFGIGGENDGHERAEEVQSNDGDILRSPRL